MNPDSLRRIQKVKHSIASAPFKLIVTFGLKFITRLSRISKRLSLSLSLSLLKVELGICGAKPRGITEFGNSILELNQNYALGLKGTKIQLPRDNVIYQSVKNHGSWELEESKFLAEGLIIACSNYFSNVALLDIGANTGLVSLQAMNLSKTSNKVLVFEPIPKHVFALSYNLQRLANYNIYDFALSDRNGVADIFTESTNHGNTSLLTTVVPEFSRIATEIKLVETTAFFKKFLIDWDKYVIKCDTQGMDALILSRIPNTVWQRCERAVIEVWALPEIKESDVVRLVKMLGGFENISWNPLCDEGERVSLDELVAFWLSKTGKSKNLFLWNACRSSSAHK